MTHSQLDEIEARWRAAGRKSGSSDMEAFYYGTVPKLIGSLRRIANMLQTKPRKQKGRQARG